MEQKCFQLDIYLTIVPIVPFKFVRFCVLSSFMSFLFLKMTGNFFLTKSGSLKLGDFGIATKFGPSMESTIKIGTPYYISPEVWEGKPYLASADLWSMGCILYELCALQVPFEGTTIPSISKKTLA